MRKTLFVLILILVIMISLAYAADQKLTALTELTAVADSDVIYIVDDPGGTPLSKKITVVNLFDTIDTFSELNTIVADKTLVNEEDAAAWDALGTFNLGITITTGDPFTLGAVRWDNGSDLMDGEQIADDTIDNDSIDWGDMTDLTTDGALDADVVDEAHIADNGIDSEHYNDGSIDLVHLASAAYAKDLVTTAPVTGAADNIFVGADSDVTLALDFTAAWDFGGAASLEIPNADDPDVDAIGEITQDANGAGEANDVSFRAFDSEGNQFMVARKLKTIQCTIIKPNDLADATRDACPIWSNETGMTFTVWKIEAWSDTDDTVLNVEEEDADGANNASVDELTIATDGTGVYYTTETTITGATIEANHILLLDFDDTDDPGWVKISICGWFNADVD